MSVRSACSRALFLLLAASIAAGCSTPGQPSSTTIRISNDSAIPVIIAVNGARVGRVEPGFRGPFTDIGSGVSPRIVTLTTVNGTSLGSPWDAQPGEFELSMDPACGAVRLWVGMPDPTFGATPTLDVVACPT